MKIISKVSLEQCPKCKYEYKPFKTRIWYRCPKCKHVYSGDKK